MYAQIVSVEASRSGYSYRAYVGIICLAGLSFFVCLFFLFWQKVRNQQDACRKIGSRSVWASLITVNEIVVI